MIEFNGSIDSYAEKFFLKRSRRMMEIVVFFTFLVLLPICLIISINTNYWLLTLCYLGVWVLSHLVLFIPQSKKENEKWAYRKIFFDGEYIVCENLVDKHEEFHLISEVELVIDFGYFYHIKFSFGNGRYMFICQKNLLVKGTLEEFEAIFEGKIIRKIKQNVN